MRKCKLFIASLLLLSGFVMTAAPLNTYAYDPLASACTTTDANGKSVVIDSPNCANLNKTDNPLVGPSGLLTRITRIIAVIAGFAGILVIVIGGFNYITSAGDAQKAKKARDMVVGALIGLVIVALAQFIITFVLKKL